MRIVLFCHSLLSDWNHGNAHFLRGIATELLVLGHDVRVYEPWNAWSLQNLVAEQGNAPIQRFRMVYPGLTSRRYRQPALDALLLEPARRWRQGRFVVAGPQYPSAMVWPANVQRIEHLPPAKHRAFYNAQRFTLNITRADMVHAGYSPSVRLFEAAACAVPIISDYWQGLQTFFTPGREILVASSPGEALHYLRGLPESTRVALGCRARARVLAEHTAAHRAAELEAYIRALSP